MVYSALYPVNNNEFEDLREALGKLKLNDSSFTYVPEVSDGLGFGFRCGFLGMLHREIIQQRLERDCDLDLIQTAPNVTYEILNRKGETLVIDNPQKIPDAGQIEEFREPIVKISFLIPASVAADAGSQPIPARPITALASAISCSLTLSTTPCVARISFSALGHDTGSPMRMAVARVSGCVTALNAPPCFQNL